MKTLYDKIWDKHLVWQEAGKPSLLYIDMHLVHEVTSPQAFEGLRLSGRKVRRPDLTLATMDHSTPTRTEQVFGGVGVHATTPAELRHAMEEAIRSKKPTLINAVIDENAGTESGRITSLNPSAAKKK